MLSIEFASTTLFITCILTELLLFCYFGNEVTVEVPTAVCSGRLPQRARAQAQTSQAAAVLVHRGCIAERAGVHVAVRHAVDGAVAAVPARAAGGDDARRAAAAPRRRRRGAAHTANLHYGEAHRSHCIQLLRRPARRDLSLIYQLIHESKVWRF